MTSTESKDHQLGINVVCQYLEKDGATIKGANGDLGQHPQVVAEIEGRLHFIAVVTVRYPDEARLDPNTKALLLEHASKHGATVAFAPVGLWPTGDRDAAGQEGFHVKYEGIQSVSEL